MFYKKSRITVEWLVPSGKMENELVRRKGVPLND